LYRATVILSGCEEIEGAEVSRFVSFSRARGEGAAKRRMTGAILPNSPLTRPFAALRATLSPQAGRGHLWRAQSLAIFHSL